MFLIVSRRTRHVHHDGCGCEVPRGRSPLTTVLLVIGVWTVICWPVGLVLAAIAALVLLPGRHP